MKKLALVLALGLGLGALVGVAPSANAARSVYPGSITTSCRAGWSETPIVRRTMSRVYFGASAAGTGRPRGVVTIRAVRRDQKVSYARSYSYKGYLRTHPFRKMRPGRYTGSIVFTPLAGSVFKGCSNSILIRLRVK